MPVTDAFLATCRADIEDTAELAAFRAAVATYNAADRAGRPAAWQAVYGHGLDHPPAYKLRKAIRDVVGARADATVTAAERQTAYGVLVAEYAPDAPRPRPEADEKAELLDEILEGYLS